LDQRKTKNKYFYSFPVKEVKKLFIPNSCHGYKRPPYSFEHSIWKMPWKLLLVLPSILKCKIVNKLYKIELLLIFLISVFVKKA
jgi:hypothetical protein